MCKLKLKYVKKSWLLVCIKDKNIFILMYLIFIVISIVFIFKNDQDEISDSMKELWLNFL